MRITFGDLDGAAEVLTRVRGDPDRHNTAQGDLPAAAAML